MVKPCVKCGAKDRKKRGNCRPCARIATAKYRASNPEKTRLFNVKYRTAHPEKVKIAKANWAKTHPEKMKIANTKWSKINPEKARLAVTNWREANPENCRIYRHNYRARKKANGGKLSPNLAETLFKRQKGKCVCCKEPLGKDYHLDHIMPLSLGGKNEDWNIQLLRAMCNLQKNAKHPVEFMQSRGLLL